MAIHIGAEINDIPTKRVETALLGELTAIRAAMDLLLAKLDADAGVTDTNYAATCTPAAAQVKA